jgi:hypothetical protein
LLRVYRRPFIEFRLIRVFRRLNDLDYSEIWPFFSEFVLGLVTAWPVAAAFVGPQEFRHRFLVFWHNAYHWGGLPYNVEVRINRSLKVR